MVEAIHLQFSSSNNSSNNRGNNPSLHHYRLSNPPHNSSINSCNIRCNNKNLSKEVNNKVFRKTNKRLPKLPHLPLPPRDPRQQVTTTTSGVNQPLTTNNSIHLINHLNFTLDTKRLLS